ncbi:hypothetical protein [Aeromonas veronii]|uniref:hypothetical protein n=1 Tax=Aeromonas veronii TaxID=654 RepID=UPI0014316859|nr:hypothetical protein [Aeromonas veronii]MCF5904712.1 hypothetical protein [Aeromonas veronii]NJI08110.1 hypothetical protein [Aeromonas veronii]
MTPPLKERHCTSLRKTGAELDQASGEGKYINTRPILNKYREKAQKKDFYSSLTIQTVNIHMKMKPDNPLLNNEKFKETRQHTIASMGY